MRSYSCGVSLDHWLLCGLFRNDRRMSTGLNELKVWAQLGMVCHVFDESCALGMTLWLFLIAKLNSRPLWSRAKAASPRFSWNHTGKIGSTLRSRGDCMMWQHRGFLRRLLPEVFNPCISSHRSALIIALRTLPAASMRG